MNIEEEIVTKLSELKYHIAVAESCTGGLVAAKLINVAGVSEVLDFSMITYANEAKIKFLDVSKQILEAISNSFPDMARHINSYIFRVTSFLHEIKDSSSFLYKQMQDKYFLINQ